jgi:hypothetical protein
MRRVTSYESRVAWSVFRVYLFTCVPVYVYTCVRNP